MKSLREREREKREEKRVRFLMTSGNWNVVDLVMTLLFLVFDLKLTGIIILIVQK